MRNRPAALIFILITVLIDVIGFGIIIPVFPELMEKLTGSSTAGVRELGYLSAIYAVMQFLCAPVMGALSDRFGRRPVLLAAIFGTGFDYILLTLAPNVGWLFVGRTVAGIFGASFTVANAYIADVSAPEDRAKNFGMIGAMFGLGFILGPLIGGKLGHLDVHYPFAFAAGLSLLNGLYGLFVLPESLTPERRRTHFAARDLDPFRSLAQAWKYPVFRYMCLPLILLFMGQQAIFHTWAFFATTVLKWNPDQIGNALAVVGVATAIVQAGLVGIVVKKFGEKKSILLGFAISAAELFCFGLARTAAQMYGTIALGSLGGIAGPTIQGFVSRQVAEDEQGTVQGSLTSLQSLVSIIGPLVMTSTFAYFNSAAAPVRVPGAAFFLGSIFAVIAFFVTLFVFNQLRQSKGPGPVADVA